MALGDFDYKKYRRTPYAPSAPTTPQSWNIQDPTTPQASPTGGTAPQPYPTGTSTFEPMGGEQRYPLGENRELYQTAPKFEQWMQRQADLLGPFANVIQGGDILRRADIPLIETGLNFQQLGMSEADRQRAFEELARGRQAVGASPEAGYLKDFLTSRMEGGGPFDDMLRQQIEGAMRNQAALGFQGAERGMTEDFARRGLGGSATEYQLGGLQQQAGADLSSQIADFRQQAALANQAAMEAYTADFQQQSMMEAAQRAAFDQALASIFSETERAPIDLSALVAPKVKGRQPI
jgi:hypothetical protein